jgi:hypothetical protein
MFTQKFGIEIEFTGITRTIATKVVADYLGGRHEYIGGTYSTEKVTARDGRIWKVMSDGSIQRQRKEEGVKIGASELYSVELVSPILTYQEDIKTVQELVRRLRKAGAFTNKSCGIHIHLDGTPHTPEEHLQLHKYNRE